MRFKVGDIVILGGYQPATIVGIVQAGVHKGNFICQWTDTIGVLITMEYDQDALVANGNVPHRYGSWYRPSIEMQERQLTAELEGHSARYRHDRA